MELEITKPFVPFQLDEVELIFYLELDGPLRHCLFTAAVDTLQSQLKRVLFVE